MKNQMKEAKKVMAALLTHINMGKTSFTPEELDEELPVEREIIEQILEDLEEKGLFTASEEDVYTVAADIGDFRDYYLTIEKQGLRPVASGVLDTMLIPERIRKQCGFAQQKNHRLPPVMDVEKNVGKDWLDNVDLEEWLKEIDSGNFDELFDKVFGDDED